MFSSRRVYFCVCIIAVSILLSGCFKDSDQDGIPDNQDNCVTSANADQADDDSDGVGNVCDNCPTATFLRFSEQRDSDGDGIGDVCDNCINVKNQNQFDTDADGIGDACAGEAANTHFELLEKASPDECFYGVGEQNIYASAGIDADSCEDNGGIPKRNEGYIWGMTRAGKAIYFGTNANVVCNNAERSHPYDTTNLWVCEKNAEANINPLAVKDHRPPSIYRYDTVANELKRLSVGVQYLDLLRRTNGLRSAGNYGGVVFLAGPARDGLKRSVGMFAFRADTGGFLGAKEMPYNNIRHWLVENGRLYCGVRTKENNGTILKWTGTVENPFQFEAVGQNVGFDVDYLCAHDDRIFVTTWSRLSTELFDAANSDSEMESAVWMSPKLNGGELSTSSAGEWQKVWSINDYEPDSLCALLTYGGPLMSYNGWLYWSTMYAKDNALPYTLFNRLKMNAAEREYAVQGAHRAIAIFRGQNLDGNTEKKVELLYGEEYLDVFSDSEGWHSVPNNMSAESRKPIYGHAGFGNRANNYTWIMKVFKGRLYVGTMDELGADLYCFPNSNSPAMPVSVFGLGNVANHGIRTMVADDDYLYLGTANHYSLSAYQDGDDFIDDNPEFGFFQDTSAFSNFNAVGGWELYRLSVDN